FDTAFHQTMDEVAYIYPVPYYWYKKYGVRKYGAHGTSHRYIAKCVGSILGSDNYRLISCHIGNGASICAIQNGKCVDTSMGFTPLAGVMMGTRSGDIDPSIIPYVMNKEKIDIKEFTDILNQKSGLLGLSEASSDMRDIIALKNEGNEQCHLAFEKYVQTIVDYIAKYYVRLGGADVICFTAGVGENSAPVRLRVMEKLASLGVKGDLDRNNQVEG
ncbi:acetate/propionate family kinase, partial [Lactococcus sp.]|uniref:acetate/propionate family kinase n=1 Tax=Lactococcus sp. TaxID=44273 RepID=UPI002FC9A7DC